MYLPTIGGRLWNAYLIADTSMPATQKVLHPQQLPHNYALEVPGAVPGGASGPVSKDFAGFAFEGSSFVRYAQTDDGNTNQFSLNLIDAITSRTGGQAIIRLGGTSSDYGKYKPDQKEPGLPVAEQNNYQDIGHTTIGPSYWALTKNFPAASWMVQVPLASTDVGATVQWAKTALDGIGADKVHSIQIGNEPNFYNENYAGEDGIKLTPPDWQGTLTNESYAHTYTKYREAIIKGANVPSGRFFTAFDVAANVNNYAAEAYTLAVGPVFGAGIDSNNDIKEVSHHYYQNNAGSASDLESGLMTLSTTHDHLDAFKPRIQWLKQNKPDIDFILNEVGNSLEPTNKYEYQNRLGSALWQLEFYLYAITIGVDRINYQQIMHAGYNLWLPVDSAGKQAQVFANFYSQPLFAEFIGKSGNTRVAKLDTSNAGRPNLAVYAAYEGDAAKRVVIANLAYWTKEQGGERPSVQVDLKVPGGVTEVTVKRLSSPDGASADASTITYGGSQWTAASQGKEVTGVRDDTQKVQVKNGVASVEVPRSAAALVTF